MHLQLPLICMCFEKMNTVDILMLVERNVTVKKKSVYDHITITQPFFKVISKFRCSHWCILTIHSITFQADPPINVKKIDFAMLPSLRKTMEKVSESPLCHDFVELCFSILSGERFVPHRLWIVGNRWCASANLVQRSISTKQSL